MARTCVGSAVWQDLLCIKGLTLQAGQIVRSACGGCSVDREPDAALHCLSALHRPADDPAGIKIHHYRDIGEALVGSDVGDISDPGLVRGRDVELPIQRVVDDNGRPAAVNSRTKFVSDLSLYPGDPRQAGNPVGAGCLAVVEQLVVTLGNVRPQEITEQLPVYQCFLKIVGSKYPERLEQLA